MDSDVEMYAPITSGNVTASNGKTYRIQSGVVRVPASTAAALISSGYRYVPTSEADPAQNGVSDVIDAKIVVSSSAPSDADGRPDGTIYIQTT